MKQSSARRSRNNCAKLASLMSRFMKWVLRSKTCLWSFPPSTLRNDKRPRDTDDCHPERSEGGPRKGDLQIAPAAGKPRLLVKSNMKHKPFRGFTAILFKEFIVVWRDPLTLFFFFFPPLIEMVAFGYALDNDVKHMAMLVLNEDRTVESRLLINRFVNAKSFREVGVVQYVEQLKSEMRRGSAYAA